MPLTAEQRAAYGRDWGAVRLLILERADYRCECAGECGWVRHLSAQAQAHMPTREELERGWIKLEPLELRCTAVDHEPSPYTGSRVVLTVAHLDRNGHTGTHEPERLKAMCQGCHLSYDRQHAVAP